jgi:hypothetical protein
MESVPQRKMAGDRQHTGGLLTWWVCEWYDHEGDGYVVYPWT